MREILFRAKSKVRGNWVEGCLVRRYNGYVGIDRPHPDLCFELIEVEPETIGQYTGLCDRNGTRIFEGDIVKGVSEYFGNGSLNQKAVVLYDKGQFLLSFGDTLTECNQFKDVEVLGAWHDDIEVIGNIHDNLAELEMIE